MPIWGYLYCGLFILSCCFSLYDRDRLKRSYQPAGEILDCICGIGIFLLAFEVIQLQQQVVIASLFFVYTFAWSYHAHRHYLNYDKFKSEIHQSAAEAHDEIRREQQTLRDSALAEGMDTDKLDELFDEIEESYNFEKTEKDARKIYVGIVCFLIIVLLPYVYVYMKAIGVIDG